MTVLAVAAISARMLAEAAREDGFDVVALDLFGDADTRRACAQWLSIGRPDTLRIEAASLLPALDALAQRGGVTGWIAGSGFEGQPELLERGAARLPLIGTPAGAVRRVRDPQTFFGFLDAEGIAHPPVRMTAPADATGWLVKDARGCGGWHIQRAMPQRDVEGGHHYFQREVPGTPMSVTFIANGSDAHVLGFNQQIVRPFGAQPFVFCGVLGPLPLPAGMAERLTGVVRVLAAAFSLRGLGSLDFMLDGDAFSILEVNPRPPASMALYGQRHFQGGSRGVVAAHMRACLQGELPHVRVRTASDAVEGTEIVFAPRALRLDEPAVRRLAEHPGCHDLPLAASSFEAGDPVCSVSASSMHAGHVQQLLDRAREAVHQLLETHS